MEGTLLATHMIWPTMVSLAALIVWAVRQEGRINHLEKESDRQGDAHDSLDRQVMDKLSVLERSLARIEGHLEIDKK